MIHALAHWLGWNYCRGIVRRNKKGGWDYGTICQTCGRENWYD